MSGINSGILRNAYPLSPTQIKEVEKDVILNNKCIAYLNENNEICFAEPFDPIAVKNFAWHHVHQIFEQDGSFIKKVYKKTGRDTFTLSETFEKTDIDGSWGGSSADTLAAGLYEPGAIALYQAGDKDGASAMKRASWDKLVDGGALTLTDGALSMGTGIIEMKIPDNLPELNEYGFYYNVCYGMTMEGVPATFMFKDDGSAVFTLGFNDVTEIPTGVIIYGDHSIDLSAMDIGIGVVSDDASMITFADVGMQFVLGETVVFYGDLVLPTNGSVSSFSSSAFKSVLNLTGIVISEGVSSISEEAFYDCNFLTDVTLPNSLVSIGESAFGYCRNLTSIVIPENVTSISNYAFDHCEDLLRVDLPKNLVSIGDYAFRNCTTITSITIPDGVTSIGKGVFYGCWKLSNVVLPNELTRIGNDAFSYCYELANIIFKGTLAEWQALDLSPIWNQGSYNYIITCTDFIIDANGDIEIADSWDQIIENVNNGTYLTRYKIGEYKHLDLGTEGIALMQIAAFDADTKSDGTGTAPITWIAKWLLATTHNMNTDNTNKNGWEASELRMYLQNDIWSLIPINLQNAIVAVNKTYYDRTTLDTKECSDKLWIPSVREVGFYGSENNGPVYSELFTDDNSRIKMLNSTADEWWLRSAVHTVDNYFHSVQNRGASGADGAPSSHGVALSFCI